VIDIRPEFRKRLIAARRALLNAADPHSRELARIISGIESRYLRLLDRGSERITRETANRITATLNRIVLEATPEMRAYLEDTLRDGALSGLQAQAQFIKTQFGVTDWANVPAARVRDTFRVFEEGIASGRLIRVSDPKVFARWTAEWSDHWAETSRGLQRSFIEGVVMGKSWLDIAHEVTDDLGELKIAGRMNADDFARGFTRAKLTEIANEASVRGAIEAGLTLFVNQGVPDDRQSEQCAAASEYPAMSMRDWNASPEAPPPRHVLNCRCLLMAVVPMEELAAVAA